MNINGGAKPNAFETSGLPKASRQHGNDENKKKRWGCSKIGTAHKMWNSFGKSEVSKTLGFAARRVLRAQIMFRAAGYNGRASMNPLYPTYKNQLNPSYKTSVLLIVGFTSILYHNLLDCNLYKQFL